MILQIGKQLRRPRRNSLTGPIRNTVSNGAGFTPLEVSRPEAAAAVPLEREGGLLTGFTLLEILLVVVIIAIVVTITTPQFRKTLTSIQLANTTQDIAQFMRYLRVKANTEKKIYQLKFDLAGARYFSQNESRAIPSGINIALTLNPVNFYPDGSVDKASIFLFKGKEEFYKDIEKAVNKEFDLGQIQTVSHTEYIYTITTQPSIGRIEVTVPE